jgi:hypothetical protein
VKYGFREKITGTAYMKFLIPLLTVYLIRETTKQRNKKLMAYTEDKILSVKLETSR